MKSKRSLIAILLGVGLCFVPALGYGEVKHELAEVKISAMDFYLLQARVDYMMRNPTNFLEVRFYYDTVGTWEDLVPKGVYTKGKIYVWVTDIRDHFSHKSGIVLRNQFKKELEAICSYLGLLVTNMNTDIVATFESRERIPLGYFYQGEYHLWGEK